MAPATVQPGIDALLARGLGDLRGAALALWTGASGVTAHLVPTIAALQNCPEARLVALFGAEHGLRGEAAAGEHVDSAVDPVTGLPVYSLYGRLREPTDEMLAGIEAILVDIHDVGVRYYTYPATLHALLRAAARRGVPIVVLDRPNPLTGMTLEGPITKAAFRSFVSMPFTPIRHGLTLGELARWMNLHEEIGADLRVVPAHGWRRGMWFDATGLPWVPPSPNIPTTETCLAYTATCLIEGTSLSEGRGTAQPFSLIGAPWVDGAALAALLNDLDLPGVRFRATWFRPTTSKHAGATCGGVQLHIRDRDVFAGVRTGMHLLAALRARYPEQTRWVTGESGSHFVDLLLGSDEWRQAIDRGESVERIIAAWSSDLETFAGERQAVLLYPET